MGVSTLSIQEARGAVAGDSGDRALRVDPPDSVVLRVRDPQDPARSRAFHHLAGPHAVLKAQFNWNTHRVGLEACVVVSSAGLQLDGCQLHSITIPGDGSPTVPCAGRGPVPVDLNHHRHAELCLGGWAVPKATLGQRCPPHPRHVPLSCN